MSTFREWLKKLLGLQTALQVEIEQTIQVNTTLAGAVARAEACKEAEVYAAELERTHPHLAAGLRATIAKIQGGGELTPLSPPQLIDATPANPATTKKLRDRRTTPELPSAATPNTDAPNR